MAVRAKAGWESSAYGKKYREVLILGYVHSYSAGTLVVCCDRSGEMKSIPIKDVQVITKTYDGVTEIFETPLFKQEKSE